MPCMWFRCCFKGGTSNSSGGDSEVANRGTFLMQSLTGGVSPSMISGDQDRSSVDGQPVHDLLASDDTSEDSIRITVVGPEDSSSQSVSNSTNDNEESTMATSENDAEDQTSADTESN